MMNKIILILSMFTLFGCVDDTAEHDLILIPNADGTLQQYWIPREDTIITKDEI